MREQAAAAGRSLSRQEFETKVLRRANSDPAFRQQLLADPRAALRVALGVDLPPEIELQALQETPSQFYIVLPFEPEELSDEQLARVAGGVGLQAAAADYFSPLKPVHSGLSFMKYE